MPQTHSHQPRFNLRTHGGSCVYSAWIYDGDSPIAQLSHRLIDEPEHELLYFGNNPRPLLLRSLVLRPGGRPLFEGVQMYWQFNAHNVATTQLLDLQIDDENEEALRLTAVMQDPNGIATSTRTVTITYDAAQHRYMYDFDAQLDVHYPGAIDGGDPVELEMADPWYVDLPAPSQKFTGMWPKRPYTHFLVSQQDGSVYSLPINHRSPSATPFADFCGEDGRIVLACEKEANPAIELPGSTGARTRAEVCAWGYDMHLITRYTRQALASPIRERFRLTLASDDLALEMYQNRQQENSFNFRGQTALPYYERQSGFQNGAELSEPAGDADIDPYFWEPAQGYEEGLGWRRDFGRTDDCCLQISKDTAGPSRWICVREGQGSFVGWWPTQASWRVVCWVKTQNVTGGASLGVSWYLFHKPTTFPIHRATIVGTQDWTRLEVTLPGPAPQGVSDICLFLEQDGAGTTWFDDLVVEPVTDS